ncbi:Ufm1-specific protease 2 [Thecamonas trahens ATCC 50062]|uniref:Ufm1-specific protease 2 n=1 Tax=Thecamonas trahens ATCC 50062 TaxID=461836 RepID=A0A0L0DNZ4_THETB|nr:Ufm1-specific protease 2 [Thecamonas trahens ATCC 50062]KNC54032.1 Ufm1-specific protease 2 [Thecamonas trahens ATCC 50062]|eukprot:XP_013754045.1 Ufm1-specific protease 2 [Thecamonas trahens ATCC 50062]
MANAYSLRSIIILDWADALGLSDGDDDESQLVLDAVLVVDAEALNAVMPHTIGVAPSLLPDMLGDEARLPWSVLAVAPKHGISVADWSAEVLLPALAERMPRPGAVLAHFSPAVTGLDYPVAMEMAVPGASADCMGQLSVSAQVARRVLARESQDPGEVARRRAAHELLGLPLTSRMFDVAHAMTASGSPLVAGLDDGAGPSDELPRDADISQVLVDVHTGVRAPKGTEVACVDGSLAYFHYGVGRVNDAGWGCAYRSLQTLASWLVLNSYTQARVLSIREIQEVIVAAGGREAEFIGSSQWIGSMEVGTVLTAHYGVVYKILSVPSGAHVLDYVEPLMAHFAQHGSPVMIGGGVLAYTLLGVAVPASGGEAKFLILDPHYSGQENAGTVRKKGWVGWKDASLFKADAFYNFCLPQTPAKIPTF